MKSEEEINKVITEYMGHKAHMGNIHPWYHENYTERSYTDSLDALIPVVEKLELNHLTLMFSYCFMPAKSMWYCKRGDYGDATSDKSPSLALATACYKVIKELD